MANKRARKIDSNQPAIVEYLRLCGCSVAITSRLGDGFPDLVVAKWGSTVLVEVKDGSLSPSRRRLTPEEEKFKDGWSGAYFVVESLKDAEELNYWLDNR